LFFIGSVVLSATAARAVHLSVPAIDGDDSRLLLGDGTGVIIGIIDSGVDDTHPTLTGLDSLGNPRMVAEANFVRTEPGNTGDDVAGHGTAVSSAAIGSDATYTGLASDARFINARVLDSDNSFSESSWVLNGVGFAIDRGADVLNLSLNYSSPLNTGTSQLDLMLDWAAFDRGVHSVTCSGNVSQGGGYPNVRGPGSAYNAVAVGRTDSDYDQIHSNSAVAFTGDGRMKPDVAAPGTGLFLAENDWETQNDFRPGFGGCSYAAPHVAGMIAQQLEAGNTLGLSTSPLVIKAAMLNAGAKVLDHGGDPWEPADLQDVGGVNRATQPLDTDSGAGQINGAQLAAQYVAGEQGPGTVDPVAWDLSRVASGQSLDYVIDPDLDAGDTLTATLTWFRHVTRTDDGNGEIDADDSFVQSETLDDLNLQILRGGVLVAESVSELDNVEHLHLTIDQRGEYTVRVVGASVVGSGTDELFGVAWSAASAVPEPSTLLLGAIGFVLILPRRRFRRR